MKLKQIVFNSLQRPKSKHKKKEKEQKAQQPTSPKRRVVVPALIPRGREWLQPATQRVCGPLAEEPVPSPPPLPNANNATGQVTVAEANKNPGAVGDIGHVTEARGNRNTATVGDNGSSTVRPRLLTPAVPPETLNFNLNTEDGKCACYKHLIPLDSPSGEVVKSARQDAGGYSSVSSAEDSGFISLPKTRTRIKTNPWLPSPRSTPVTSPDVSPTSSSVPSPVYSERHPFGDSIFSCSAPPAPERPERPVSGKRRRKRRDRMATDHTGTLTTKLNIPVTIPQHHDYVNCDINTDSLPSTDDSDSALQRSFLSESDNACSGTDSAVPTSPDSNTTQSGLMDNNANQKYHPPCIDVGSVVTSCSSIDDQVVERLVTCDLLPDTPVSFDYEEAFENQLEVKGVGQYVGSRDDLSETLRERITQDPLGSRAHDFDSEYCPSVYDSSLDYTSETETDDTVCDDYYTATGFRGHGRPGPFNDLFRDYYHGSDGNESDNSENSEDGNVPHPSVINNNMMYQYRKGVTSDIGHGRAVTQLHTALQERVTRLHYENLIVDEKMRESREAESLHQQERKRYRKEVNVHRKRLLLRTLQELRSKLEEQSQRLQQTYTAVLSMQRAVICDRREEAQARRQAMPPDTREAPF